jgi:predicted deacylase
VSQACSSILWRALPLAVAGGWLAGCDPSPASQALNRPVAPEPQASPDSSAAEADPSATADPVRRPVPRPASLASAPRPKAADESNREQPPPSPADLELLGARISPGTTRRLTWSASEVFEGVSTATPVLVVNGKDPGPVVCVTAAIHGDELNGIEMVRRIMHELDPDDLAGAVIGVPIVNLQGFRRGSRYLPDRRDLNRYFPGNPQGSSASRIAYSFFEDIIRQCDTLVDLHTGSFYRTNLPQLRADLRNRGVRKLSEGFGGMVVLHSEPAVGTLRRAATDAGIPTVTLEAGEPLRLQSDKVSEGVSGILALLGAMDMIERVQLLGQARPVIYQSSWIRADHGGILFSLVRLGQVVEPGDVLGTITDPITNEQNLIYASSRGRVLGMAVNQVVMPGFAAFRLGVETDGPPVDSMLASSLLAPTEASEDTGPVEADGPASEGTSQDAIVEIEETS